ncbi:MAG: abortive infection family protein [candidate division Zixibacteria bacterium]|nr:abortive infection family protein [candidate division Zixibacteria bacterium]
MTNSKNKKISEVIRRDILDYITVKKISWSGRLEETEFLSRLYDLESLPSYSDTRCNNALQEIAIHREHFNDWPDNWVFYDERFNLLKCNDGTFLAFICEMVHPVVEPDTDKSEAWVRIFNSKLSADGWIIKGIKQISNKPVYGALKMESGTVSIEENSESLEKLINSDYIRLEMDRIKSSIKADPSLAIGTSKELIETICKTILDERKVTYNENDDFTTLAKNTFKILNLAPSHLHNQGKINESLKIFNSNLISALGRLAELRNPLGTGHGKTATFKGLETRHAKLAAGIASAIAVFIYETHTKTK